MREEDITESDTDEFDYRMPWCLYDVMLIEKNNGISRRIWKEMVSEWVDWW
jgi:hypothetical protein